VADKNLQHQEEPRLPIPLTGHGALRGAAVLWPAPRGYIMPVTLTPFSLLILCVCNLQQKLGKYIQLKINAQGHRLGMRTPMIKQH
jgi:hypothetical protein